MKTTTVIATLAAGLSLNAAAQDKFTIVGSSTVYPFAKVVAEELNKSEGKQVVLESTGSGGGHKIFATGKAAITNSSRRIKPKEFAADQEAGIKSIFEAKIGYDGIAIANSAKGKGLDLTLEQLFRAVAKEVPVDGKIVENPYKKWSDIDASLPDAKIVVYGPPTTSGTRDAFHELVLHKVVKKKYLKEYAAALFDGDEKKAKKYQALRTDGGYVDAGEQDNLIVQKLEKEPNSVGIFGYSFLVENPDKVQGAKIGGISPTPDTISSGEYPISRSLFFYVDLGSVGKVDGVKEYAELFFSEKMIGGRGLLKTKGLIPLPKEDRAQLRKDWEAKKALTAEDLEKS